MLDYERQNSQQTLGEAVSEYYAAYSAHFGDRIKSPEANDFFRDHDVLHVVFGCDISLDDELMVKICSICGTTAGFSVLKGYQLAESKDVYRDIKLASIIATTFKSLLLVPKSLWLCARMVKRWGWDNYDEYLDTSLADIRKEFGIHVPHSHGDAPTA